MTDEGMSGNQLTREEVARIELGTDRDPAVAGAGHGGRFPCNRCPALLPAYCDEIGSGKAPACRRGRQPRHSPPCRTPSPRRSFRKLAPAWRIWLGSSLPRRQLRDFEDRLNETSLVTRTLAPWVGWVIKGMLRGGDEQAYFGRDGWLFYRQSVDSVTGPGS